MILTGAYDQTGHYYYLTIGQIALDDMGDDVMLSNGAFGYSPYKWNQYTYDYTQYARINDGWWSSYCSYLWRKAYTAINQCNLIIENADNLPEGCEDYLAQAHGLRGWNFLNLYHLFCPAYLNKTLGGDNGKGLFLRLSSASSDKSTDVPRSDLKASMQQIIDDLTYASSIALLPVITISTRRTLPCSWHVLTWKWGTTRRLPSLRRLQLAIPLMEVI